jgi:hypothetical protein
MNFFAFATAMALHLLQHPKARPIAPERPPFAGHTQMSELAVLSQKADTIEGRY